MSSVEWVITTCKIKRGKNAYVNIKVIEGLVTKKIETRIDRSRDFFASKDTQYNTEKQPWL